MSLAQEFFPTLYEKGKSGGDILTKEALRSFGDALKVAMAPGEKAWESLSRTDPETGAPIGYLAIKKERLVRKMLSLRTRKIGSKRFGRRLQFA